MNTYTNTNEQVPCIKLVNYKVAETVDHTFTLETVWEDQCHHQYVELFHDNGDDTQGVWTECIQNLPSLQHAAAELKIQEALHAKQGGYTNPDHSNIAVIETEISTAALLLSGILVPAVFTLLAIALL